MSGRAVPFFLAIIALAAMSLPAFARPNATATIKTTIDVDSNAKLGSTTLTPGQYHVVVEGSQAKFERDGKTVAEVPCTLKELPQKAQQTEFQMNRDNLTEIQVAGKSQAIDFSTN